MNKKLIYINFAIIGVLIAIVAFLVFQNQKLLNSLVPSVENQTVEESPSPATSSKSPTPSPKRLTVEDTQNAILEFTNNTAREGLSTFMTDTVGVVLYATDCCQPQSKETALSQMSYINEGLPITFDQKNTTIVNLKAKNPQFAGSYVGISQTKEHLIAFTIDPQTAKITDIHMSVSRKLYEQ